MAAFGASLKPPEAFSFKPSEWPAWIREFRRYRNASKLSKEDGDTQTDCLLYVMGRESEKIFSTFTFAPGGEGGAGRESNTDFETVVKKFDKYFGVKKNIIHERAVFQERRQKSEESVEEFYRALTSLAEHCGYNDLEDQIRDRLVVGLKDQKTKEKLQLTNDLNLQKALDISRQQEQIKEQMKEQKSTTASDIDEARKFKHRDSKSKYDSKSTSTSGASNTRGRGRGRGKPKPATGPECDRCGYHHAEGRCPARGERCRECKGKGHFRRKCFKLKGAQEVGANEYSES